MPFSRMLKICMAAMVAVLLSVTNAIGSTVPDDPSFTFTDVTITSMPVATCSPPFKGLPLVDDVNPDDVTVTIQTYTTPVVETLPDAWGSTWGDSGMLPEAVHIGNLIAMVGYNDIQDKLVFKPHCAAGDQRHTIDMVIKVNMSSLTN